MLSFALLLLAAYVASLISGAAGFGGALLLLPLLVAAVGPMDAVPLVTLAQLVGNLSRMAFGFTEIRWRPVCLFLAGALPLTLVGAYAFVELSTHVATRVIGVAILLFVLLKQVGLIREAPGRAMLIGGGAMVGFLSGLVGSAGPLGATLFLALKLPPVAYIASEAVTAVTMHAIKIGIYQHYIELDRRLRVLAVAISIAMVAGTFSARRLVERLTVTHFERYVTALLVAISIYMVIYG